MFSSFLTLLIPQILALQVESEKKVYCGSFSFLWILQHLHAQVGLYSKHFYYFIISEIINVITF